MTQKTIITCAVTGNQATRENHPALPVTPEEIATACLEGADAGAAIVHIHVRDPETGAPSMELAYYREVVERIRAKNNAVILNLTTGPGGRYHPSDHDPAVPGPRTNLLVPEKRAEHIVALKPEIATLDLNTMTFGREVVINTPRNAATLAGIIRDAGVKPEIEVFDSGDIRLAHDLIDQGALTGPGMFSIVTGIKYGFPSTPDMMATAARMLPQGAAWTGFGVGRMSFPMAAQSWLLGGHVRVGMEDNSYLSKGVLTKGNGELVERVRAIIEQLGGQIAGPSEARHMLGLAA
ncbi:3-keto-5-aminohexanoate cleavage protein [uncultured Paracoccus sp.]|uniref:3-keto-5-aminohexanoate cleavage protein n=1 Tax=uncultured Paracoccus sp. TaxID=189685 RepID=UPI002627ABA2|nr:3-keto-5-aminohexanoate cleavage protein [uncultured Paracoccus sp.]